MLRPLLLVVVSLSGLAGCIAPAKIASVEADTALPLLSAAPSAPVVVETLPLPPVAAPGRAGGVSPLSPDVDAPALPVRASIKLTDTEPADRSQSILVAMQPPAPLPGPPPPPQPSPPLTLPGPPPAVTPAPPLTPPPSTSPPTATPPTVEPLTAESLPPMRVKPMQDISLDIAAPAAGDDMLRKLAPPIDYAAQALPLLAAEHPFVRGELIGYGMPDNGPLPGGLEMCYQPLYFQELNAERYGRSWGILQPAVSVANFYGRIPLLPYMAFSRPARRCTYHDHYALPGYRIPVREPHQLVVSPVGGVSQTAALIGVILLIP